MQSRTRAVAIFVFGLFVASSALLVQQSAAQSLSAASGVFVSYSATRTGVSLTVQQGSRLLAFSLTEDATARERSVGEAWRTISFANIAAGEPVTLHLDPGGLVRQVDAEYATVTTRLVTYTNGFVVTTSGAAYKLVGSAAAIASPLGLGTFLKLRVDPQNNAAFDVTASSEPFSGGPLAEAIAVTFVVSVPTNTPAGDIIYVATDSANWIPNGVRMSPLTGNRWTATLTLGKGTSLKYKYTRGSWATSETNQAGIEIPNRSLSVTKTGDAQKVEDAVVRWSDLPS